MTYQEPGVLSNEHQPLSSNQSTGKSTLYEVPCELQYEYVDKTTMASPKTFTYDYAAFDGPQPNKTMACVELNRIGQKKEDTHDDYVIRDESYVTAIESEPDAKKVETHDDYVIRDESYVTAIESEPDAKKVETHDDYVIRDESYVTAIESEPDAKEEDAHDDYVIRDESYVTEASPESKEDTHDDYVVRDESYVTVVN